MRIREDSAADSTLVQTHPVKRPLVENPSEDDLRILYPHAPGLVRLGMIAGPYGEATGPDGSSRTLSGPEDLRVMRVLRAAADVVVIGAATAIREGYGPIAIRDSLAATRAPDQAPAPVVAIVGFTGTFPPGFGPDNALFVTTIDAPAASLVKEWGYSLIITGRGSISPHVMIAAFIEHGMTRVLCEGGPALARLLLDHDAVDEYCLTESPLHGDENGPVVPDVPPAMEPLHALEGGGFTMRRWSIPPR